MQVKRAVPAFFARLCLFALTALPFSCAQTPAPAPALAPLPAPLEKAAPAPLPAPPPPSTLELVAVGDNLIHIQIINASRADGTYDFAPIYQHVKDDIANAGIAFINQETLTTGAAFGLSGYPQFNGPAEMGETIAALGFDVVNHATNHVMDKGEAAVRAMIAFWEERPAITYLGIHASPEARERTNIIEKNGIRLGFLAYTYGTNGLAVPKSAPYLVSLIDKDTMTREIDALRPLCDYLIVSMHWGDEYERAPSRRQEELAAFLAGLRVDLVLGHHPHVLQEMRLVKRPDGGETLIYFSLGNFVSAQNRLATLLGGMAKVTLAREDGAVRLTKAALEPLVTHYERDYTGFRVYPLNEYTEELAARHGSGVMDLNALRGAGKSAVPGGFSR